MDPQTFSISISASGDVAKARELYDTFVGELTALSVPGTVSASFWPPADFGTPAAEAPQAP